MKIKEFVPEGLKKCPLCDAEVAIDTQFHASRPVAAAWTARIVCRNCRLTYSTSSFYESEVGAIQLTSKDWNMRVPVKQQDGNFTAYLTPRQEAAFHAVATSLLVDTRQGNLPSDMRNFTEQAEAQKKSFIPNRASLVRMAEFCIQGIMLLDAEKQSRETAGEGA